MDIPADIPETESGLIPPDELLPEGDDSFLKHETLPGAQVTSFAVAVAAPDGSPVTDAAVLLKSASGKTVSTARHVSDGQYIFETILDGSYTVEITAADGRTVSGAVTLGGGTLAGETAFVLPLPPERSDLGIKAALAAGGVLVIAIIVGSVVGHVRRKKAGRKRTWYRSM